MTAAKKANLLSLSKYLTCSESRDYYRQICGNDHHVNVDDIIEVDDDDNSDGCED